MKAEYMKILKRGLAVVLTLAIPVTMLPKYGLLGAVLAETGTEVECEINTTAEEAISKESVTIKVKTSKDVKEVYYSTEDDYKNGILIATYTEDNESNEREYSFVINNDTEIEKMYYVWAVDNEGRTSVIRERKVIIEQAQPEISALSKQDSANQVIENGDWAKGKVTVKFKAEDIGNVISGIERVFCSEKENLDEASAEEITGSLDENGYYSFTKDGEQDEKYYIFVYDKAGNECKEEVLIKIDETGPEIGEVKKYQGGNEVLTEWVMQGPLTVEFKVTDEKAGVKQVLYGEYEDVSKATGIIVPDANGIYSFDISDEDQDKKYYIFAYDKLDNLSDDCIVEGKIDKTRPVISKVKQETEEGKEIEGWTKEEKVIVKFEVTDTTSGVSEVYYRKATDSSDKKYNAELVENEYYSFSVDEESEEGITYEIFASDNAGREAEPKSVKVRIDRTPPVISEKNTFITDEEGKEIEIDGWTDQDVNVKFKVEDAASGDVKVYYGKNKDGSGKKEIKDPPKDGYYSFPVNEESKEGILYYIFADDSLGNKADPENIKVYIDKTPPKIDEISQRNESGEEEIKGYGREDKDDVIKLGWTNEETVKVKFKVSDIHAGISSVECKNEDGDVVDVTSLSDGYYSFDVSGAQQKKYNITATDHAGVEGNKTVVVQIDLGLPRVESYKISVKEANGILKFFSFGTFGNGAIEVKVKISDEGDFSSGISSEGISLFGYDKIESTKLEEQGGGKYEFIATLPITQDENSDFVGGNLKIKVTDNAGNASVAKDSDGKIMKDKEGNIVNEILLNSDNDENDQVWDEDGYILLEDKEPEINFAYPSTWMDDNNESQVDYFHYDKTIGTGKGWFQSVENIALNIAANDAYSGLDKMEVFVVDQNGNENDVCILEKDYSDEEKEVSDESEITGIIIRNHLGDKCEDYRNERDGSYLIRVIAEDNAGNKNGEKETEFPEFKIYIDKDKPSVKGYQVVKETNGLYISKLGAFNNNQIRVEVKATDAEIRKEDKTWQDGIPSSGIREVTLYSYVENNGSETEKVLEDTMEWDSEKKVYYAIINKEFEGSLKAEVKDHVGNSSGKMKLQGEDEDLEGNLEKGNKGYILLEEKIPDVSFSYSKPIYQNGSKNWFKEDISIDVNVKDVVSTVSPSGIQEVKLAAVLGTGENTKDVPINVNHKDYPNIRVFEDTITFETKKEYQNPDGSMVIKATVIDNAGNEVTNEMEIYMDYSNPTVDGYKTENVEPNKILRFLTFGLFGNGKIEVSVKTSDKDPSSGIPAKGLTLYKNNASGKIVSETMKFKEFKDGEYIYTAALSPSFEGTLEAQVTDHVTHTSGKVLLNNKNSEANSEGNKVRNADGYIYLETKKPDITIDYNKATYTDANNQKWYEKNIAFTLTIADIASGINHVSVEINGQVLKQDAKNKEFGSYASGRTFEEKFTINTSQVTRAEDGSYTIVAKAVDNAGNERSKTVKVYKDNKRPQILEFNFEPEGIQESENQVVEDEDYGYYFTQDTKVTVSAKDDPPSSGLKSITYRSKDAVTGEEIEKTVKADGKGEISFPIKANFKGQISAKPTDYVGNEPNNYVNPKGSIVESKEKHDEASGITITAPDTSKQDINGNNLYASEPTLRVNVEDSHSGIRSIDWSIESVVDTDQDLSGTVVVDTDGNLSDAAYGWTVDQKDRNLATRMSRDFTIRNNSNDIKITITMTDRAGYTSKEDMTISLDKTEPTIEVTYDQNDPLSEKYYKDVRTATIVVTDRNFDPDQVTITTTNSDGTQPGISGWSSSSDANVTDSATHTCTVTYDADGDYTFTMDVTDRAGNMVNYGQVDEFTIDRTIPIINVSYDNSNASNLMYYNEKRIATITIDEHNFSPDAVVVTQHAQLDGTAISAPTVAGWSTNGDSSTASIAYDTDGDYSFEVTFRDMAGNEAESYTGETFVVDLTEPEVEITNVEERTAYNDVIAPGVTFTDINYSTEDIKITLTGNRHDPVDMTGSLSITGNNGTVQLDDFARTADADDIYTIRATVADKAGNSTEIEKVFSVNRFGSNYELDDETKALVDNYFTNEEQDLVIREVNVSTLEFQEITYSKDGELITLEEGKDFDVSDKGLEYASWKEYTYTIHKSNFEAEGEYVVNIMSEDAAQNSMTNRAARTPEYSKEVAFIVDKTAPTTVVTGIENNAQYTEEGRSIKIDCEDNIALETLALHHDGSKDPVKTWTAEELAESGGIVDYALTTANNWQTISIVSKDKAGNASDAKTLRFLLTTNLMIQYVNNKPILYGSIGGVGILTAGTWWILFGRRRFKSRSKK